MAWIKVIKEDEASGELREFYDKHITPEGVVDNILKIHSLNPPSLQGHYDFYRTLMFGKSDLSRVQREMIAVAVSVVNKCHYWITHHGAGLRRLTKNDVLLQHLKRDYKAAPISSAEMAMLDYAVKLTKTPWEMIAEDIAHLRQEGFSDAAILDINQITGYYNFVNRLADGLGVELEHYWYKKS